MRLELELETLFLEFENSQIVFFHQVDDGSNVF